MRRLTQPCLGTAPRTGTVAAGDSSLKVGIRPSMGYVEIEHEDKPVRIQRNPGAPANSSGAARGKRAWSALGLTTTRP